MTATHATRRCLLALISLALLAATWTAVPATAATGDAAAIESALAGCTGDDSTPYEVTLPDHIEDPGATITVNCTAVLNLDGHDLTVRNVVISAGNTFTVTDTNTGDGAGTLTADATDANNVAGIRNSGATFVTDGGAHVVAMGGSMGAGVGAGVGAAGGTGGVTISRSSSTITATGGQYSAGIGGTDYGNGGTTTTYDESVMTAQGGYYAAGIGGGYGGVGGDTTSHDESTIHATAGDGAAGIGGGALTGAGGNLTVAGGTVVASGGHTAVGGGTGHSGPAAFGSLTVADGGVLHLPSGDLQVPDTSGDATPEVVIEDGGVITGSADETPTYATIRGDGQIDNGGAIRMPTENVTADPAVAILDHAYSVSFDPNGGTPAADPVTVYAASFDDGDRTLPTVTRPGYTFGGWYTADNTRIRAATTLPGSSEGTPVAVPLTARWNLIPPPGVPMSAATITGDPTVGSTLTAMPTTTGTPPADTTYTYEWRSNGTPIPGATASTLEVDPSLVDTNVSVRVTATAPGYSDTTVTSEPVTIEPGTLPLTGVDITGDPTVGSTLTATPATTGPDPDATAYTYQWAAEGAPIPGATNQTLDLDPTLAGTDVTVTLTGTAPGYDQATVSSDPVTIEPGTLPITGINVTGKPRENHTLHAELATTSDLPGEATTTWTWYAGKKQLTGTTGPDLLLGPDQVGRRIKVVATTTAPGRDTDTQTSGRTDRIHEGRYLTATNLTPTPGDTVRAYGRGPHKAQSYTLLIHNHGTTQRRTGKVGDNGAFRQRVNIPTRACGTLTLKIKLANKNGKTIWTRTQPLALPPC